MSDAIFNTHGTIIMLGRKRVISLDSQLNAVQDIVNRLKAKTAGDTDWPVIPR